MITNYFIAVAAMAAASADEKSKIASSNVLASFATEFANSAGDDTAKGVETVADALRILNSPPPRKLRGKERIVAPLGNEGDWVRAEDYPPRALMQELQGVSALRLTINTQGRVKDCIVTTSSGSDDLDDAACDTITKRAIFIPELDRKGNPIEATYTKNVRWQIPNDPIDIPNPGQWTLVYTINEDGTVSNCKAKGFDGPNDYDPCKRMPTFMPPVDRNGKALKKQVVLSQVLRVGDLPQSDIPGN